jgi:hypothetical protein
MVGLHDPAGQQDVLGHPFHSRSEACLGRLVEVGAYVVNSVERVTMVRMDAGEVNLEV